MPAKKTAKVLGRCDCPQCGERMAVLQNSKNYLYSRCPNCKCDQRNGAPIQTYLWYKTDWIEGEPDHKPHNVPDQNPYTGKAPQSQPEKEPTKPEKPTENQQPKKLPKLGLLLVPVGVILAIAARA